MFYSEIHSEIDSGPPWARRRLGDRVRDALDLALALLLLEDDYDVDWELPEDFEQALSERPASRVRRRRRPGGARPERRHRRPGTVAVKPQPCLSPVRRRVADPHHQARSR